MGGSTAVVSFPAAKKFPETVIAAAYEVSSRLMDSLLHDARNPLNALAINLEVLSEKLKDDEGQIPASQEKNLKAMREQIFRLDGILKQFAEVMAPRPSQPGEVNLTELAQRVFEVLGHESRKRRVKFSSQLGEKLVARTLEPSAVSYLMLHAMYRALCRAPAGGEVSVKLERLAGTIALRVTDSGGNVPEPSDQAREALDVLAAEQDAALRCNAGDCEIVFRG